MQSPELTVDQQQVVDFLQSDFHSFMDNSQSPDPTNGISNYSCHGLQAHDFTRRNTIYMPKEVQPFYNKVMDAGFNFNNSLHGIIGQGYIGDDPFVDHYAHLVELANT